MQKVRLGLSAGSVLGCYREAVSLVFWFYRWFLAAAASCGTHARFELAENGGTQENISICFLALQTGEWQSHRRGKDAPKRVLAAREFFANDPCKAGNNTSVRSWTWRCLIRSSNNGAFPSAPCTTFCVVLQ